MASSTTKFPYQRLTHEGFFDGYEERERLALRSRSWLKFRRVNIRRRFRLKVPRLRKFLRRKVKLVSAVRVSCAKVLRRFKEGQCYLGDLFAGNYLFMQVHPCSLKSLERSYYPTSGFNLSALPSRYPVSRID